MAQQEFSFTYERYDSSEDLAPDDRALLETAQQATRNAYAPYSRFRVGAAARLGNGQTLTGTNQENASFPAGICAERTLMSTASSLYPGIPIVTMAITYDNENGPSDNPISPCGICRQSFQEFEQRTHHPIRLILAGQKGEVLVIPRSQVLLPFAFTGEELL